MTDHPDGDDDQDDEEPRDPRGRRIPAAVFASNWWVVLAADAAIGLVIAGVGLALAWAWEPWIGLPVVGVGVVYGLLVIRRGLQWHWLRREAGSA